MINLIMVAVAPSFTFIIYMYIRDRYDREPLRLLLFQFIAGAAVGILAGFIEMILEPLGVSVLYKASMIGITEEAFKLLAVFVVAYKSNYFNEKLDGIVYCVFASLGFATLENIGYVFRFGLENGFFRAFSAVPAHMFFGITMGFYLALYKYCRGEVLRKLYFIKALIIPALLHAIYDYIAISGGNNFFVLIILLVYIIYLAVTNSKKLNKYVEESRVQWNGKDVNKE